MNYLEVVAIGIEEVGAVVPGMIRALSGRTIVAGASFEGRAIATIYGVTIRGLERDVDARRTPFCCCDEEFVGREELGAFGDKVVPQRSNNRPIELPACLEVRDTQVDVIDQSPEVEFHRRELPRRAAV